MLLFRIEYCGHRQNKLHPTGQKYEKFNDKSSKKLQFIQKILSNITE